MSIITTYSHELKRPQQQRPWMAVEHNGFLQVPREHRDVGNLVEDHLRRLVGQADVLIMCVMQPMRCDWVSWKG
jgi:hypothetical protein